MNREQGLYNSYRPSVITLPETGRVLYLTRFFLSSSYSAGIAAESCILRVSPFFLLLSSGNTSFSHTSLHPILTKLGQSDRYLDHYSRTKDGGVRGHDGVTGVKSRKCQLWEKYENSTNLKTNYVILQTIVNAQKKSTVTLSYDPT